MITATLYRNQFDLTQRETITADHGCTLRDLTQRLAAANEWPVPTVALVNGEAWMRKRWTDPLPDGAVVEFRQLVRGGGKSTGYALGGLMVAAGIVMIATGFGAAAGVGLIVAGAMTIYSTTQLVKPPSTPNYMSPESGSPTYTLDGRANRARLGEPIPVIYGTHRVYPDTISKSFAWFESNDQYVASLLCVGMGSHEIDLDSLRFGEASAKELDGIRTQVLDPGQALTLFHSHVTTSEAISGQTLEGPKTLPIVDQNDSPLICELSNGEEIDESGTYRVTITANFDIFAGSAVDDDITIAGSAYHDGVYPVVEIISDYSVVLLFPVFMGGESGRMYIDGAYRPDGYPDLYFGYSAPSGGNPGEYAIWIPPEYLARQPGIKLLRDGDTVTISHSDKPANNRTFNVIRFREPVYLVVAGPFEIGTAYSPIASAVSAGYSAWCEAAGPNDVISDLAVDLVCPRGIGNVASNGSIGSRTVTIEVQYEALDTISGEPIGSIKTKTITISAASQTPQRSTTKWVCDTGSGDMEFQRARIRARRTSAPSTSTTALDEVQWTGLKAYLQPHAAFYGVTTLAVIAKATQQLTGAQAGKINITATRKLPAWTGSAWSTPAATNSIAWALADALRNADYGCGLSDAEIDMDSLAALHATWEARGDTFNAVFDQSQVAWEALQAIARAGRAQPVLAGGMVTFVRAEAKTIRTAMFGPESILPNSLRIEYRLPQDGDNDGTSVAWIDPATWQPVHIDYRVGGGFSSNPQTVDLFGVTNHAQATREAVYLDRVRTYQRKAITWRTEMDGHLATVGDLVALSHDVPAWGQSGALLGLAGTTYSTSEPLTWTPGATHYVLLRRPDGSVAGPYAVTQVSGQPQQFVCTTTLDFAPRLDLSDGDRTTYSFGPGTTYAQDVIVTGVTPLDATTCEITAVPYDARIHASGA
jgi:predicted phage tail protein